MYGHLDLEKDEELLYTEVFLASDEDTDNPYYVAPGGATTPTKAFHPDNPFRPKWVESKTLEMSRLKSYECWRKLNKAEELLWR